MSKKACRLIPLVLVVCGAAAFAACESEDQPQMPISPNPNDGGVLLDSSSSPPIDASGDAVVDAPVDAPVDALSADAGCGAGEGGVVDQEQTGEGNGGTYLGNTQKIGQTFVAGKTGMFAGIETPIGRCNRNFPADAAVRMTLKNASGTTLGTVEILTSALPAGCPAPVGQTVPHTLFDLRAACIPITAGTAYSFEMTPVKWPAGVCTGTSCTAGDVGRSCLGSNSSCELLVGTDTADNRYDAGVTTTNGSPQYPNRDLMFKVYVQ